METTAAGIAVADAVALVNATIRELEVGPERVTAVDPAAITVDWTVRVPSARLSKMSYVTDAVKRPLRPIMHQMPQVLLVADDGVVTGIFGLDSGVKAA